jgi:surface protein
MQHSGLSGTGLVSFTDAAWVAARLSAFMLLTCMGAQVAVAAPADDFVTTWKTDNPGASGPTLITVPMVGGPYDVDWDNDGIFDEFGLSGQVTHDFLVADTYTIRIRGAYDSIRLSYTYTGDGDKILSLDQWGTNQWTTMAYAFHWADNLQVLATDTPDFSAVIDMSHMFDGATAANPDTSGWDTSAVTDMSRMFTDATAANPDTSGWDTSLVTNMSEMFRNADSANPDTSGWDTSAVTNVDGMFAYASSANPDTSGWDMSAVTSLYGMFAYTTAANPDTSGWDTAAVTSMYGMFNAATSANPDTSGWDTSAVTTMFAMFAWTTSANPDTSGWDTAAVTDMWSMFEGATSANPDTSSWDTSAVTRMRWMFRGATSANPDTSGWDTSAVTTMYAMFNETTSANPDTSGWDTSAVTDMSYMFADATSANPDTGGWDTSAVTGMRWMFRNATSANPDTSGWDTSAVRNMEWMFKGATSFDRDIGSWNVTALLNAYDMFGGVTLSTANYDSLLEGWGAQALQPGVTFSGGNSTYCSAAAAAARAKMIASDSWAITDGGEACPPASPIVAPDLTPASDTGVSDSDNFTTDNIPDFYVDCSTAGNTIMLYTDNPVANTAVGSYICIADGIETASVATPLIAGVHNVTYTDSDANGESGHSPSLAVTIDTIFASGFE